jgi:hypothetical protein
VAAVASGDVEMPVNKEQLTRAPADPLIFAQWARGVAELMMNTAENCSVMNGIG